MNKPVDEFDYQRLFEQTVGGEAILEDLVTRFSLPPSFDEHNAEIKTYYRAGQRSVIDFILSRINRANGVSEHDE
ncbi:Bbp19 family protein [Entomomonas asaccharolytica]|uniref:Bbp19-like phage domain-containing protein n=1 Tax=Entomomonas asaccharolytica TaxID=2785331 RepID=A0A974NDZ8_9GAMM|nr:hypothetical protein [Entomomonas asaccharolytica]QQP84717.1 hypothetical protein JHT90_09890 [Entomomonas asaccharolytica]